jgi:serine/threonine-protein kinase
MAEQVGRVLGERYRLVAPIGAGASARVYLADDTTLGRQVAVKLLHEALSQDQAFLDRFAREARMAAQLQHAHIVAVHDWGYDGEPFIVNEFCSGGSLRSMLDQGRMLTPSQALLVGLEAARALEHAHRRGVVHRDIKPSNLLFDADGRLRIADFGLARALAEASTTEPTGAVLGTARYASPEQARGQTVDGRGDVYSLALVLVEAVTGRVPFEADTTIGTLMARVEQAMEPPEELGPLVRPLQGAGAVEVADRLDAADLSVMLMATAERLPRPEPLPLVGALAAGAAPVGDPTEHGTRTVTDPDSAGAAATPPPATATTRGVGHSPVPPDVAGAPGEAAGPDQGADAGSPGGVDWDDAEPEIISTGSAFTPDTIASLDPRTTEFDPGPEPAFTRREHRRLERSTARALATQQTAARAAYDSVPSTHSGRRWPWVIVALALIGGVGAAIWFARESSEIATVAAPDLIGGSLDDAESAAEANGWELEKLEGRPGEVPIGEIYLQNPAAGTELVEGDTLQVTVSLGEPLATIPPDLIGLSVEDVGLRLSAIGLMLGEQIERFDEDVPAGQVLEVSSVVPDLPRGSAVDVVVSSGPAPREVPSGLVGMEVAEATALIESARFVVTVDRRYDEEVPEDSVIEVDPTEGTELEVQSVVTLLVSDGPEPVEVPDVEGLDVLTAAEMLEEVGLCIGETEGPANNEVLTTDPPAGEVVDVGTCVRIITRESTDG